MKRSFIIVLLLGVFLAGCSSSQDKNIMDSTTTTEIVEVKSDKPERYDDNIKNNSLAISPDERIAIVSNSDIDKVKVYDLKSKKEIGELSDVVTPRHIAFSKDGTRFYLSDSSYGTIREYDTNTLEQLGSFDVGKGVFGFTLTNKGDKIFANNQSESTVTVINLETGIIEKVIEGFSQPRQGIVIDANDKYVYVTNFEGNDVRVINTDTMEIEKTLSGIPSIRAISVDTENNLLYGASSSDNTINVVDINTGEIKKSIPVGKEPYGAALSPDKTIILSGEKGSNQVSVIDTNTLEVLRTIEGLNEPRQAIVYSSEDGKAYVLNADLSISIIDYVNGQVLETIK